MTRATPRVFISYSHDSDRHKKWVLNLASQLRAKGVDAVLDQWDLKPGKDVTLFMEEQLAECDFAILVCTQRYVDKAMGRHRFSDGDTLELSESYHRDSWQLIKEIITDIADAGIDKAK